MEKQPCPLNGSEKHKASPGLSSGSLLEPSRVCASQELLGNPLRGAELAKAEVSKLSAGCVGTASSGC